MANNRAYLICEVCGEVCGLFIAKYYPSSGWYDPGVGKLDEFMNEHAHSLDKSLFGPTHFNIKFEQTNEEALKDFGEDPLAQMIGTKAEKFG